MSVSPQKQQALDRLLATLGVRPQDVREQFVRASGPGGQKVNKTSSAVSLKHLPTGIEVKAQQARSQALNRFYAWRSLAERLQALQTGALTPAEVQQQKIRKQKRRRQRRATCPP